VVDACIRLCATHGVPYPTADALLAIGSRLGACRILLCEAGARHRLQKLQLNFPCDDVSFALKDDKEMPWLAKHL
jgi:origin recognition complex subunit 1